MIFRDRQDFQSSDFNNFQGYIADTFQHLTQDAITDSLAFSGGLVTAASATEVSVSTLRLYSDGQIYVSETAQTLNLFQYLPTTTKRIVAVVLWGQQIETNTEPRDFLVDLVTGATQPQNVPMQRLNLANVNLLPGAEAADPQPAVLQSGTLAIAYVHLIPTGIESIEMLDSYRIPNVQDHEERMREQELFRDFAEPKIGSIATDLAALGRVTSDLATRNQLAAVAADTARVKTLLNLPATYAAYDADFFTSAAKTDPNGVGYGAVIDAGLLFPLAAQATAPLALFNPYESSVYRSAGNLVLPKFTEVVRIDNRGPQVGSLPLANYQVQSQTLKSYTETKWELTYGLRWNYHIPWWMGPYIIYAPLFPGLWLDVSPTVSATRKPVTKYELVTTTESYTATLVGETALVSNTFWATSLDLRFTDIGPVGDVTVVICETINGQPDMMHTLARTTVNRADLKLAPITTNVPFEPVLLESGKRYAFVLLTGGEHSVATVDGNNYTDGTLFYSQDTQYMQGDFTKDIWFAFNGARFEKPRTEVVLQNITLAGGITDIKMSAKQVVPEGTSLEYEMNIGGIWYRLTDQTANRLSSGPEILPLRAVFLGTSDMAPAMRLASNAIIGSRNNTSMVHWSTTRTLSAATTTITLQAAVKNWDAVNHTITPVIKVASTDYTPTATVESNDPDGLRRFKWTFTVPSTTTYSIKISGTRTSDAAPFQILERIDIAG